MNIEEINKIANELAKEISKKFKDEKKLVISDITAEHEATSPFREFFNIGFWVGNGFIYRFFQLSKASASVISSNPYNTYGSTHQFIDVESSINEDEAKEILNRVKKILSEKYEIERYYEDEDEYIDDFFNSYI